MLSPQIQWHFGASRMKGLSKKLATFIEEIPTWMKESEEEKSD